MSYKILHERGPIRQEHKVYVEGQHALIPKMLTHSCSITTPASQTLNIHNKQGARFGGLEFSQL